MGYLNWRRGCPDKAVREYQQAASLEPRDYEINRDLGDALIVDGRVQEGIERLYLSTGLKSEDVAGYDHLGEMLIDEGFASQAVPVLKHALKIDRSNKAARAMLVLAASSKFGVQPQAKDSRPGPARCVED